MGKWMSVFTPEAPPSRTPVATPCWASSSLKIPRCLDSLPPVAPPGGGLATRSPCCPGRLALWASGGIQPLTEAAVTVGPVLSRPRPCRCSPKVCRAALGVAWMVGLALPLPGPLLGLGLPLSRHWVCTLPAPRTGRCRRHPGLQAPLGAPGPLGWTEQGAPCPRAVLSRLGLALPSVSPTCESCLRPVGAQDTPAWGAAHPDSQVRGLLGTAPGPSHLALALD